jgi:hypothetical protein
MAGEVVMRTGRWSGFLLLWCFLVPAVAAQEGIPVSFDAPHSGYYTIVIDSVDADGDFHRIRNLVQEEFFTTGAHTLYWDGYDEGEKIAPDGERPYAIRRFRATPARYRIRALMHEGFTRRYEFSIYQPSTGPDNPPYMTEKRGMGGWIGEHGQPSGVVFLPTGTRRDPEPQMLVGSSVGELYNVVAAVGLDGRVRSKPNTGHWINHLYTRDVGPQPLETYLAYATWDEDIDGRRHIRVQGLRADERGPENAFIARLPVGTAGGGRNIGALAAYNGFVFVTWLREDWIGVIDAATREFVGRIEGITNPRGIEFGPDGWMYVSQGVDTLGAAISPRVTRYRWTPARPLALGQAETVISGGLNEPMGIRFNRGPRGWEMYVADWGYPSHQGRTNFAGNGTARASHQIKVYGASDFGLRRTIGRAGGPQRGLYDEERMHLPRGFDIDSNGRLWVAEFDFAPKRVSVWNAYDGTFEYARYGNAKYSGGGHFHPEDSTRFFYQTDNSPRRYELLELEVDWERRTDRVKRVLYRSRPGDPYGFHGYVPLAGHTPETPIVRDGRLYFASTIFTHGRGFAPQTDIYLFDEALDHIRPVASIGRVGITNNRFDWAGLEEPGVAERFEGNRNRVFYSWTDLNGDGRVQPDEVQRWAAFLNSPRELEVLSGGYIAPDLSYSERQGFFLRPRFTPEGYPVYDLEDGMERLAVVPRDWHTNSTGASGFMHGNWREEGRDEMPVTGNRYAISLGGPLAGWTLREGRAAKLAWIYHVPTPTSHSGEAFDYLPRRRGEMHRNMQVMNMPFAPGKGEAGDIWAIAGYHGSVHVMTADGFYVTDLGGDCRVLHWWNLERPEPGDMVTGCMRPENYNQTLYRTPAGGVVLNSGGDANIFTVQGWGNVRRFDLGTVEVTASDLAGLGPNIVERREMREDREMTVALGVQIDVDGDLGDWPEGAFVHVDAYRGIVAAVASDGEHLFAAWSTGDPQFLNNPHVGPWQEVFRGGGGLDLFIANEPSTDRSRGHQPGDIRIFVTNGAAEPFRVVLFERTSADADPDEAYVYSSPINPEGVRVDRVVDITDRVEVAGRGGDFELAVPLEVLGMELRGRKQVLGDVGVVVGNGAVAVSRSFWNNRTRIHVNDLPTEAEFWTRHMGILTFKDD